MSYAWPKFLRNEAIEGNTEQRIHQYEAKVGQPVTHPVPVEQIVVQVPGLDVDYDEIEEIPGEQILSGLDARNRKIFLNAKYTDPFEQMPGRFHIPSATRRAIGMWNRPPPSEPPNIPGFDIYRPGERVPTA